MGVIAKPLPDTKYLEECFYVNFETGELIWKHRPDTHFRNEQIARGVNAKYAGKVAGMTNSKTRYRYVWMDSVAYKVHRIIWKMKLGADPVHEIDHINGDRTDNRIENLRDCTKSQNQMNVRVRANSASGLKNIKFRKDRWYVRITVDGTRKHVGCFLTKQQAIAAYTKCEQEYYGDYARRA